MSRHHFDDAASDSSYSSGSSRSSSRSSSTSSSRSGSSKKSRSSQISHSNIKSDHWSVSFMKWTTGAPPGKQLSLRRTKVRETEADWDYDDTATVYSDSSYISYAWVSPKWDDSISVMASRSNRSSGRARREHRSQRGPRFVPPSSHQPPPPFFHPHPPAPPPPQQQPPPHFMPPPEPMYDDYPVYDDAFEPEPQFQHPHPPHPPFPPQDTSGGAAPFIDLNAGGGGGGARKYEPW